jgi:hypothetical protein
MPKVDVSEETFAALQSLAKPLIDSPDSVIKRLLDAYLAAAASPKPTAGGGAGAVPVYSAMAAPDLTHTKPIAFSFDGTDLVRPSWNGLLVAAIYAAHAHAKDAGELKRLLIVPHVKGRKEDEGFTYLPTLDLSYQGQDANSAWKAAHHVAQQLGLSIAAEFVWRHKEKAAFPGQPGRLEAAA